MPGLANNINKLLEELQPDHKELKRLYFMLTTGGGIVEEVERIVNVTRHFYEEIIFIVPDYAYSAGTVLCMSGDEIYMNYFSVLGPIDPQVQNRAGQFVPAQGYLDKVNELIEKSQKGRLTSAEFMMLKEIDLADLRSYEQAKKLTVDLLEKWLVKYKFKNWEKHSSTGRIVTLEEKQTRAKEIAQDLGDNNKWKSHGRGIDINTLQSEFRLKIYDYGADKELSSFIHEYYSLAIEYIGDRSAMFFHTRRFL